MPSSRIFSFEFFPPKTPEGKVKLRATWQQLAKLKPRFFSVTFGAGGSTQQGTLETVMEIRAAGQDAAPAFAQDGAVLDPGQGPFQAVGGLDRVGGAEAA